jgi:hypothetical protein
MVGNDLGAALHESGHAVALLRGAVAIKRLTLDRCLGAVPLVCISPDIICLASDCGHLAAALAGYHEPASARDIELFELAARRMAYPPDALRRSLMRQQAENFVGIHWPAISVLAGELAKRRSLDAADLARLCWWGPPELARFRGVYEKPAPRTAAPAPAGKPAARLVPAQGAQRVATRGLSATPATAPPSVLQKAREFQDAVDRANAASAALQAEKDAARDAARKAKWPNYAGPTTSDGKGTWSDDHGCYLIPARLVRGQ